MKPYSGASVIGAVPVRPSLSPSEFPYEGSAAEQLHFLLKYAVLAPSGHNTQPWKFVVAGSRVHIHGDFTRAMPVADPDNRELVMSCGAALLNLRVAIRNFGLTALTDVCPDSDRPDLLATVELSGTAPSGRTDHRLFKAITDRRTARVRFERRPIARALIYRWERAAAYEDATLYLADEPQIRGAIGDLVAEGDRRLGEDPEYQTEMARWFRSNYAVGRDGLPGYSVGLGDLSSRVASQINYPVGAIQADRDRGFVIDAPAFAVLCTEGDDFANWMIAGQALGRVLLSAHAEGVSASFFLQPIEIPDLRRKLIDLLPAGTGYPQITFRLGFGPRVPPTPRRPLSQVITTGEPLTAGNVLLSRLSSMPGDPHDADR